MTVGQICQREVDLAEVGEAVRVAAQRMSARNVGTLVVLDLDDRPIGILTDRDLALRVISHNLDPVRTSVEEVMTPNPVSVREDTPVEDVLKRMRSYGLRRLLVTGSDGRLVGVVSVDDVLTKLAEEFSQLGGLLQQSSPQRLATG